MNGSNGYTGPAGVVLTPDDLLLIWKYLNLHPTAENRELCERIQRHLEREQTAVTV